MIAFAPSVAAASWRAFSSAQAHALIRQESIPPAYHFVLSGADARWAVRAAIDAVVAHAYGPTRDQYAHVLSTFSHFTYKDTPRQRLDSFDEMQSLGLEAFTRKRNPYWNIPLNENLPQPVTDLPIPKAAPDESPRPRTGALFDFQTTAASAGSCGFFTEQPVGPASLPFRKRWG